MLDLFAARLLVAISTLTHAIVLAGAVGAPVVAAVCARRGWEPGAAEWWARARHLHAARVATGSTLVILTAVLFPGLFHYALPLAPPLLLAGGLLFAQRRQLAAGREPGSAVRVAVLGGLALAAGLALPTWLHVPNGLGTGGAMPWSALLSPALPLRWLHLVLGLLTVAFAATVVRWSWRPQARANPALPTLLTMLVGVLLLQALAGVASLGQAAALQPVKAAAMTAMWTVPEDGAFRVFGLPMEYGEETELGVPVPGVAALLGMAPDGPNELVHHPVHKRPWVAVSYVLLHIKMVSWAVLLLAAALVRGLARRLPRSRLSRVAATLLIVPAMTAFLSGVLASEIGRQPWLVSGEMFVGEGFLGIPGTWVLFVLVVPWAAGLRRLRQRLRSLRTSPTD